MNLLQDFIFMTLINLSNLFICLEQETMIDLPHGSTTVSPMGSTGSGARQRRTAAARWRGSSARQHPTRPADPRKTGHAFVHRWQFWTTNGHISANSSLGNGPKRLVFMYLDQWRNWIVIGRAARLQSMWCQSPGGRLLAIK